MGLMLMFLLTPDQREYDFDSCLPNLRGRYSPKQIEHLKVCSCTRSTVCFSKSEPWGSSSRVLTAVRGAPCGQHPCILPPPENQPSWEAAWRVKCLDSCREWWGTQVSSGVGRGWRCAGTGVQHGGGGSACTLPACGLASMGPRPLGALVATQGRPASGGRPPAPGTSRPPPPQTSL